MNLTETAFLALDHKQRQIVSIHTKRTYALLGTGQCCPADKQQPFLLPTADNPGLGEADVVPFKPATDLIILATAYAPGGHGATAMTASIEVGSARHSYRILGDRRCIRRGRGSIAFSTPSRFETMPICYEHAYGGVDSMVPLPEGPRTLLEQLNLHPGVYPRNPVGRGYVVYDTEQIDGLALPNIEHPDDPLTPENLVAGGPQNWWQQPLPWSCDWFDKTWYPRVTFLGGVPDHLPEDDREVKEVKRGWVDPYQNRREREGQLGDMIDARRGNAASPALTLPFLQGNEEVRLRGMTPNGEIVVRLPRAVPRMRIHFEGRAHEVIPVPNRIVISTREMGVYVVWHGSWHTPRELPDRLPRPGDTAAMEMEGIEVFLDERLIPPLN
jgi:hypothetical protein